MSFRPEAPGPIFIATFRDVAISAAQDVFEIVAPSNSRVAIREIEIGQRSIAGDTNAEMFGLHFILGYTVTGSGGTSATPVNLASWSGALAAASTVKVNNTTIASGGSPVYLRATSFNAMGGYRYYPGFRGERILLDFSQRLVIRIPQSPSIPATFNGTLVFEEIGAAGT
jgi:hypothetical protein